MSSPVAAAPTPPVAAARRSSSAGLSERSQPPEGIEAAEEGRDGGGGRGEGDDAGTTHPDQAQGVTVQGVLEGPLGSGHLCHHAAPVRIGELHDQILAGPRLLR